MGDEEAARSGGLRYLSYLLHFAAGKQSCQDTAWPAIRVRQESSVGAQGSRRTVGPCGPGVRYEPLRRDIFCSVG